MTGRNCLHNLNFARYHSNFDFPSSFQQPLPVLRASDRQAPVITILHHRYAIPLAILNVFGGLWLSLQNLARFRRRLDLRRIAPFYRGGCRDIGWQLTDHGRRTERIETRASHTINSMGEFRRSPHSRIMSTTTAASSSLAYHTQYSITLHHVSVFPPQQNPLLVLRQLAAYSMEASRFDGEDAGSADTARLSSTVVNRSVRLFEKLSLQ